MQDTQPAPNPKKTFEPGNKTKYFNYSLFELTSEWERVVKEHKKLFPKDSRNMYHSQRVSKWRDKFYYDPSE